MNQHPENEQQTPSAGQILRDARLAKGLEVQDISDEMRISKNIIIALENDEALHIPEVYRRGYIRQYANRLNLDLNQLLPNETPEAQFVNRVPLEPHRQRYEQFLKIGSYVFFSAGVVIPLVWFFTQKATEFAHTNKEKAPEVQELRLAENPGLDNNLTSSATKPIAGGTAAGPSTLNASAAPSISITRSNAGSATTGDSVLPPMLQPLDTEAAQSQDTEMTLGVDGNANIDSDIAEPATEDLSEVEVDSNLDVLELDLLNASWVEITDAEGKRLEFDLLQAGQSKTYSGVAPFKLIFGQASAVNLKLNEEPVDLSPYIRSDVATLELQSNRPARQNELETSPVDQQNPQSENIESAGENG